MTDTPFRAVVVQAGSVPFDSPATLRKLLGLIEACAARGAKVAVFPEALLGTYPKGITFGAVVGDRRPEGREWYRRYYASSVEVPGAETAAIGKACAAAGLTSVIGVIERDGGTLYCTAVFFGPDGKLLGKHRKLMPTAAERLVWGFGDGSTMPVVDTPHGRLASVICWENYMPMLRMAMYSRHVQLYCAPTADDRETWLPTMRTIALEGRCFVLSACQFVTRGAYPADYPCELSNDPAYVMIRGGSCIIDPAGRVLAGPTFDEETILDAEIDLAEVARGKYDLDVVGHYSRPDIFRLEVNESPRTAAKWRTEPPG